jgi:hypothetical protein
MRGEIRSEREYDDWRRRFAWLPVRVWVNYDDLKNDRRYWEHCEMRLVYLMGGDVGVIRRFPR